MKKHTLFLVLSLMCGILFAQKNKKPVGDPLPAPDPNAKAFEIQQKVYRTAMLWSDLEVATMALHEMIALKPERREYLDSLTSLYFTRGAYVQCLLLGRDMLKVNPNDTATLELVSVSEQALGLGKESLEDYEKLYKLAGNIHHLYEIATLQYTLKRIGECELTIRQLISMPESAKEAATLSHGQGQSQAVPLNAAAFNLMGVIFMDVSKWEDAKVAFNKALEIFPDFVLAKNNLAVAEEKLNAPK